jgi:hypothetical protein
VHTAGCRQPLEIEIGFDLSAPVPGLCVETTIRAVAGGLSVNFNSGREGVLYDAPAGRGHVRLCVPALPLAGGSYLARVRLWDTARCKLVAETPARFPLCLDDEGRATGGLALPHAWSRAVTRPAERARDPVLSESVP